LIDVEDKKDDLLMNEEDDSLMDLEDEEDEEDDENEENEVEDES
jgi:hypothetical protein